MTLVGKTAWDAHMTGTPRHDVTIRVGHLAQRWPDLGATDKRRFLRRLVGRVDLTHETLDIHIRPMCLPDLLAEPEGGGRSDAGEPDGPLLTLSVAATVKRIGLEIRLLIAGADRGPQGKPDRSLLRLLGQAHRFREMLLASPGRSMSELAAAAGIGASYFTRVLRLSFLAPDIVAMILNDRHPLELSAQRLVTGPPLPIAWSEQRVLLGIG